MDTLFVHSMTHKILAFTALILFAAPFTLSQITAPASATISAPMKIGGDVLPPVLVYSVEPKIPRHLRAAAKDVSVNVGLTLDKSGKSTNLHVIKSINSDFNQIAIDAVAKYRFKPATLHGQPVPVQMVVQVNLQIK